jgi:hypothetical protein
MSKRAVVLTLVLILMFLPSIVNVSNSAVNGKAKQDGSLFSVKVDVNLPETIRAISELIDKYFYDKPMQRDKGSYKRKLESMRVILAKLAGQEEQLANQLESTIYRATRTSVRQDSGQDLELKVYEAKQTFWQLSEIVESMTEMRNVSVKLIAGLRSFTADSNLYAFGYDASGKGSVVALFIVGKSHKKDLSKALSLVQQIRKESRLLMQMATDLEKELNAMQ